MKLRGVELVHWNPRRHIGDGRIARALPRLKRPNNFGDLLGPLIVKELAKSVPGRADERRLLSVGSVLHFGREGDTVWGSGRNGKISDDAYRFTHLDVRAVRGPRTRAWLAERGIDAPAVYGDPALLVPTIFREFAASVVPRKRGVTVVPNLHDVPRWKDEPGFLDPTTRVWKTIRTIAESSHVVASSLHGIILAETFGVPASLVLPGAEDLFKYHDYYEGTGRTLPPSSQTVAEALENPAPPIADWDPQPLLNAFPADLWTGAAARKTHAAA
ncbi:polysaccharide pyruvyl transferase family protein [Microbacterium sp. SS28]|uniref:polysaccharide pyruvyl transferase family protein n=1 Tax=Microbacterium sp. SS28 TaxID=2919948 RepID=UPI001FA9492F|nr:polysaccharide pyruvyl transferase family protein [Microbacterium sp. SS28]